MSRFAAQLNTVRAYCVDQKSLFQALKKIKELGYDGVELESALLKGVDRQALAAWLKELKLEVCSIRSPFARTVYGLEDMMAEAKALDCERVGIGTVTASYFFGGLPGGPSSFTMANYMNQAKVACDAFRGNGLKPLYSLRDHEFIRLNDGRWIFEHILEGEETADYLWEADILSLTRAGVTAEQVFDRLAGRMPVCRLADQKIRENEAYFFFTNREVCPLGEGLFDLSYWMEAARKAGAEWFVLGQDLCDRDPFVCLELSLKEARQR